MVLIRRDDAAAAANNGLSALSAMVPQAAQGSILGGTLPPPGQPLAPSRLAAAYSHLMGRGSISTLGSTGAPATTGAGPTAATPTPPARRNYCGFTYRTVPREIPAKSPTTPSSSNYLQCAERPANSGYVNNSSVNSYTNIIVIIHHLHHWWGEGTAKMNLFEFSFQWANGTIDSTFFNGPAGQ